MKASEAYKLVQEQLPADRLDKWIKDELINRFIASDSLTVRLKEGELHSTLPGVTVPRFMSAMRNLGYHVQFDTDTKDFDNSWLIITIPPQYE